MIVVVVVVVSKLVVGGYISRTDRHLGRYLGGHPLIHRNQSMFIKH